MHQSFNIEYYKCTHLQKLVHFDFNSLIHSIKKYIVYQMLLNTESKMQHFLNAFANSTHHPLFINGNDHIICNHLAQISIE